MLNPMILHLGILNEDLADRFCLSRTFTAWIRLLRQLLKHVVVVWLLRKAIRQNKIKHIHGQTTITITPLNF